MWFMVAQSVAQITPPAATPDEIWQRVEAAWPAVPQEHIQRCSTLNVTAEWTVNLEKMSSKVMLGFYTIKFQLTPTMQYQR
ncbi:hypothetical protein TNCV_760651 [Trichonephila clavipes]|nr:hypothetical protein TNCV_760651 [Trichonephila clavipes]